MPKCLEVCGRTLSTLADGLARELPFVEGRVGAPSERERECRTIVCDVVVKDSSKDELVQPLRPLWKLGCQALGSA